MYLFILSHHQGLLSCLLPRVLLLILVFFLAKSIMDVITHTGPGVLTDAVVDFLAPYGVNNSMDFRSGGQFCDIGTVHPPLFYWASPFLSRLLLCCPALNPFVYFGD